MKKICKFSVFSFLFITLISCKNQSEGLSNNLTDASNEIISKENTRTRLRYFYEKNRCYGNSNCSNLIETDQLFRTKLICKTNKVK
jgi:hypothetical protein